MQHHGTCHEALLRGPCQVCGVAHASSVPRIDSLAATHLPYATRDRQPRVCENYKLYSSYMNSAVL